MELKLFILLIVGITSLPKSEIGTRKASMESVEKEIYLSIPAQPAFRLLSRTSKMLTGTPSRGTEKGLLYHISSENEINSFCARKLDSPIAILMPGALKSRDNIDSIIKCGDIKGFLLYYNKNSKPDFYSPDDKSPNEKYSANKKITEWNPYGDGSLFVEYKKPIFGITEEMDNEGYIQKLIESADENFRRDFSDYPLWSLEFDLFMHGSPDSGACIRKDLCNPLGGKSVWSILDPIEENDKRGIVVATSVIDGMGYIPSFSPSASKSVAIVALAATQYAFSRSKINFNDLSKRLIFAYFTGETFGYAGSSKFVDDISNFKCKNVEDGRCTDPISLDLEIEKIQLENIETVIDFSQVSDPDSKDFFVHHSKIDAENDSKELMTKLQEVNANYRDVSLDNIDKLSLPPSPVHAFIKKNDKIQGVVITDYKDTFKNKYYHSEFDKANTIPTGLCDFAELTAQTLLKLIDPVKYPTLISQVTFDCELVKTLWHCITVSYDCPLMKHLVPSIPEKTKPQRFTSIFGFSLSSYSLSIDAKFLQKFLENYGGVNDPNFTSCTDDSGCPEGYKCRPESLSDELYYPTKNTGTTVGGVCKKDFVMLHDALSLGFSYIESNWNPRWEVKNNDEPAFTESNWEEFDVRLYKKSSPTRDIVWFILTLLGSILVGIATYAIYKTISKRFVAL